MFRGKESSNRIKISQLVPRLIEFWCLGSLQLWGRGRWVMGCLGSWGYPHRCAHTHTHTHTHTHVNMYRNCKWLPPWRHPCFIMFTTCMCMCMHVFVHACTYVHWTPPHPHTHPYPNPPTPTLPPGNPGISKNSITLELIKII